MNTAGAPTSREHAGTHRMNPHRQRSLRGQVFRLASRLRTRCGPCGGLLRSALLLLCMNTSLAAIPDTRGTQFFGWTNFAEWPRVTNAAGREIVLTSPLVSTAFDWDELVLSWNADTPSGTGLRLEARALHSGGSTKFYTLGLWATDPARHPRESVPGQKDAEGEVETDTLVLGHPCRTAQFRVTLVNGADAARCRLKLIGCSVLDRTRRLGPLAPNRAAWGRLLEVPERSQVNYPGGEKSWCSPTSTSMVLAYWARTLQQPALDRDVPAVVAGVFDRNWPGTGNWPFNTAFAGSLPGLRGFVTRFTDVSEIEDWVARGVPVVVSVCYDLLRGRPRSRDSGHLVVCVGFTADGSVVVNDPGTRENVRKTFPRENLVRAWANSKNTVYLIYPEDREAPADRFGHWGLQVPVGP